MAPRRPSYTEQLERTVAELTRENEIKSRLVEVAEREIAALRAALQPAPKVALKLAAYNAGIKRPEKLRRWCEAGKVVGEQLGKKRNSPWIVDEASLADYMRRMGIVACSRHSKTAEDRADRGE